MNTKFLEQFTCTNYNRISFPHSLIILPYIWISQNFKIFQETKKQVAMTVRKGIKRIDSRLTRPQNQMLY